MGEDTRQLILTDCIELPDGRQTGHGLANISMQKPGLLTQQVSTLVRIFLCLFNDFSGLLDLSRQSFFALSFQSKAS
jgi:hypothetical protein